MISQLTLQELEQPRDYDYILTRVDKWDNNGKQEFSFYDENKRCWFAETAISDSFGSVTKWSKLPEYGDKVTVTWQNLHRIEYKINGESVWKRSN